MSEEEVVIRYTNHRDETSNRRVLPVRIWHGFSPWHEDEKQWFLRAFDLDKAAERDFAMKDIHRWGDSEV